jgi:esterase/lipase superfamily enzyme
MKLSWFVAVATTCAFALTGCASIQRTAGRGSADIYKRIPYRVSGNHRVVDVFYATTRTPEKGSDKTLPFGSGLSDKTSLGRMSLKIDPSVKMGKMLPAKLKARDELGVETANAMDDETFIKDLAAAVAASPHKSLLVVVFGYNDDFETNAIMAGWFSYMLDVNTPVLLFDWPGDQAISIGGYLKARRYAEASGPALGDLLVKIEREINPDKLWVKGSSLGCEVVCDAFEEMYKHADMADEDAEVTEVFLAAPDVDDDDFEGKFKDHISALTAKLTTYVSSDDDALLMSGMITGKKKFGRQKKEALPESEEAKDLLYLKSQYPDKVTVVDVTPINVSSFHHGYYLECPEFFDDLYSRVHGEGSGANRRLYLLKYKGDVDYWVMQKE